MQFTDLIFDLYGTLVDIHTDENDLVWEKTAYYFGYYGANYTGESLKAAFQAEMAQREAVAGQNYEVYPDIPFDGVMADLFRAKGVTEHADVLGLNAAQVFRIASTEYIRLYDGVMEALDTFRRYGFRLWLLSNAQRAFTAYELRLLGLDRQFNKVCLSSDYQCRKPDLRFYTALMEEQQLEPSQCLMIGNDRETDIAGAQKAGLATLYMHTNLTPSHQAQAKYGMLPSSSKHLKHFEYEGCDWPQLSHLICKM